MANDLDPGVRFETIFDEEINCVKRWRTSAPKEAGAAAQWSNNDPNPKHRLVGLCLSGGGVRAATFHVGLLQALATEGVLPWVDYISAVSGGGYTAAWLCKWLSDSGPREVLVGLGPKPNKPEAERIHRLRRYASYLTPRTGVFGSDNLLFVVTYCHQLFLNLLIIALAMGVLLLYPRAVLLMFKGIYRLPVALWVSSALGAGSALAALFLVAFYLFRSRIPGHTLRRRVRLGRRILIVLSSIAVLLAFLGPVQHFNYYPSLWWGVWIGFGTSICVNEFWIRHLTKKSIRCGQKWRARRRSRYQALRFSEQRKRYLRWLGKTAPRVRQLITVALGFGGSFPIMLQLYAYAMSAKFDHSTSVIDQVTAYWTTASAHVRFFLYVGSVSLLITFSLLIKQTVWNRFKSGNAAWFTLAKLVFAAALCACLAAYTAYRTRDLLWHVRDNFRSTIPQGGETVLLPLLFTVALPVCVVLGALTFHLFAGLLSRMLVPHVRETLTRLIVTLYRWTFAWTITALACFYGPLVVEASSGYHLLLLALLWGTSIAFGLLLTSRPQRSAWKRRVSTTIGAMCPYVFLGGILVGMSFVMSRLLGVPFDSYSVDGTWLFYWEKVDESQKGPLLVIMACSAILLWALSARIGINLSSMHMFYQARLAWAYLNEGLPGRDRFALLKPLTAAKLEHLAQDEGSEYKGPYLILNATLNLGRPTELSWQERLAANFVFTPLFCGYEFPFYARGSKPVRRGAYQRTADFSYGGSEGVRLAHAMAISGSALSTGMGWHTSPRVRFFHTVFNVRLGWWFANPSFPGSWRGNIPRSRVSMLTDEFLGKSNDSSPYVHLSDGGHFENLGLYELVHRKCKLILVSDASEDHRSLYRSLGTAIERCRIDLNVEIALSPDELRFRSPDADEVTSYAVGEIIYDHDHRDQNGVLIYMKARVNASIPIDVWAFKKSNPVFPNHSTANQWFGESHFEGYRSLGFAVAQQTASALRRASASADVHEKAGSLLAIHNPQEKLVPRLK